MNKVNNIAEAIVDYSLYLFDSKYACYIKGPCSAIGRGCFPLGEDFDLNHKEDMAFYKDIYLPTDAFNSVLNNEQWREVAKRVEEVINERYEGGYPEIQCSFYESRPISINSLHMKHLDSYNYPILRIHEVSLDK